MDGFVCEREERFCMHACVRFLLKGTASFWHWLDLNQKYKRYFAMNTFIYTYTWSHNFRCGSTSLVARSPVAPGSGKKHFARHLRDHHGRCMHAPVNACAQDSDSEGPCTAGYAVGPHDDEVPVYVRTLWNSRSDNPANCWWDHVDRACRMAQCPRTWL